MNDTKECLMSILNDLEILKAEWGKTFTAESIQFAIDIVQKYLEE